MTDLISLLTFPETSKAFSAYRSTVVDHVAQSSYHPRKTPRLDADSDSGSASRSRDRLKGKNPERTGPINVQVHDFAGPSFRPSQTRGSHERTPAGDVVGSALTGAFDSLYVLLRGSIRQLLTKGSDEPTASYERIYSACRGVVCVAGRGETLYGTLNAEIDQCVSRLARELETADKEPVQWIGQFVDVCAWFETQIVSDRFDFTRVGFP